MPRKPALTTRLKDTVPCSTIGKKRDGSGDIIFRDEYYYRQGRTPESFAVAVEKRMTKMGLIFTRTDCGDNWAPFSGGASTANSSHFWATYQVAD